MTLRRLRSAVLGRAPLAGLLISIEPLIDMGRTALNVSGSITAGTLTSRRGRPNRAIVGRA